MPTTNRPEDNRPRRQLRHASIQDVLEHNLTRLNELEPQETRAGQFYGASLNHFEPLMVVNSNGASILSNENGRPIETPIQPPPRPLERPEPTYRCEGCRNRFPVSQKATTEVHGNYICVICEKDLEECEECHDKEIGGRLTLVLSDGTETMVCEGCNGNYVTCYNCDSRYHEDIIDCDIHNNYYCNPCREDGNGEWTYQDRLSTRTVNINDTSFQDPTEVRKWSCEIEAYCPDYGTANELKDKIPTSMGVSTDGSLSDNGVEYQTPIISGDKGNAMIEMFCSTLLKANYRVDSTCGLHIHIDGKRDITDLHNHYSNLCNIKGIFRAYYFFEPIIAMFLPQSRRKNTYCLPLANDYNLKEVLKCQELAEFEKIWYREDNLREIARYKKEKYHQSRYHGVNFHSLLANNHIEIRHHSGTINAQKIINWATLHISILDWAVRTSDHGNVHDQLLELQATVNPHLRRQKFYDIINLSPEVRKYYEGRAKIFCSDDEVRTDTTEDIAPNNQ